MIVHEAYRAFLTADDVWQAELVKVYGKRAGDARYTSEGKATSRLAELHKAFQEAGLAWRERMVSNGRTTQ